MRAGARDGFTLAELAIVVLVVALIAALAQPNLQRALLKARAAEAIADLQVIRVAVLAYLGDKHVYPADVNRGKIPSGLAPYLPAGFSFVQPQYVIDYDNWSQNPQGFVGLSVITSNKLLGDEIVATLGSNAWTNGVDRFTWVIEWTN